jgi:hypothetical protein
MINRNFTAANFFLEYQQSCQLNLLGPFLQFDVVNWQMGCKPAFFNVFLGERFIYKKTMAFRNAHTRNQCSRLGFTFYILEGLA